MMPMYIVAIGWLYVAVLVAVTESSVVAGTVSFLFYGLLPVGLLLYFGGAGARRRKRLLADQRAHDGDGGNTQGDEHHLL